MLAIKHILLWWSYFPFHILIICTKKTFDNDKTRRIFFKYLKTNIKLSNIENTVKDLYFNISTLII